MDASSRKSEQPSLGETSPQLSLETPSLLDGIDCLGSTKTIKTMMVVDKDDIKSRPVRTTLRNLGEVANGRFDVVFDHCTVECYKTRSSGSKLYVFLSGAGRKGNTSTRFNRLTWSGLFDGICLYIEDPMYKNFPDIDVGWYYGTRDVCYLDYIVDIVAAFAKTHGIDCRDIHLIGSSCAGYAAIYVADKIKGATSISFNPQIVPAAWDRKKRFLDATGIDLEGEDAFGRHNIATSFENTTSRFVIVSNIRSERDYVEQIKPVFTALGIEPQYGLNVINNARIILADLLHPFDHGAFPGAMETKVLLSLLNDAGGNDVIVPYVEMLKSSFERATRLTYATLWAEVLSVDFPDFIVAPDFCDHKSCRLRLKGVPDTCYYQVYADIIKDNFVVSFYISDKKIAEGVDALNLMRDLAKLSRGVMKSKKDSLFVHSAKIRRPDLPRVMNSFIEKTSKRILSHFGA